MSRKFFSLTAGLAVAMLAACTSNTPVANNSPASSPSTAASPSAQASAVATTTDPCQLVTAAEASSLAGASYSVGKEETTSGGGKLCWYGAQTRNVFEVFVGVASDASTAQTQWDQEKSEVQADLLKATNVSGVKITLNVSDTTLSGADRAASGTLNESFNGHVLAASAVYMLKGATFAAIVDLVLDQPAPAIASMETQAQTVLGRLP